MSNSSLNKSNPSQDTKLVSWRIKDSFFSSKIIQPRFIHIAETLEQNPIKPTNILTILKLGGGNMGTIELPSLPHNLSQFPLHVDSRSKFQTCILFLHFFVFQLWHFDFFLIKTPLAFCLLYVWNFELDSPKINIPKEPWGDLG